MLTNCSEFRGGGGYQRTQKSYPDEECSPEAESFPGEDTSFDEDHYWYDDTFELVEDDERGEHEEIPE